MKKKDKCERIEGKLVPCGKQLAWGVCTCEEMVDGELWEQPTKRVVYYVWWATTEENDNGTQHKSEPIVLPEKAQAKANEMWKIADYVSIDQSYEKYVNGEWETIETKAIEVI